MKRTAHEIGLAIIGTIMLLVGTLMILYPREMTRFSPSGPSMAGLPASNKPEIITRHGLRLRGFIVAAMGGGLCCIALHRNKGT